MSSRSCSEPEPKHHHGEVMNASNHERLITVKHQLFYEWVHE